MSILDIKPANLRVIVSLAEKREKLLAEVGQIETQIRGLEGGKPVAAARAAKAPKAVKTKVASGKRGAIKDAILGELEAAGKAGIAVKDIAPKLGLKNQNVHVWFSSTGKKLGVKRIGPGRYSLQVHA